MRKIFKTTCFFSMIPFLSISMISLPQVLSYDSIEYKNIEDINLSNYDQTIKLSFSFSSRLIDLWAWGDDYLHNCPGEGNQWLSEPLSSDPEDDCSGEFIKENFPDYYNASYAEWADKNLSDYCSEEENGHNDGCGWFKDYSTCDTTVYDGIFLCTDFWKSEKVEHSNNSIETTIYTFEIPYLSIDQFEYNISWEYNKYLQELRIFFENELLNDNFYLSLQIDDSFLSMPTLGEGAGSILNDSKSGVHAIKSAGKQKNKLEDNFLDFLDFFFKNFSIELNELIHSNNLSSQFNNHIDYAEYFSGNNGKNTTGCCEQWVCYSLIEKESK